MAERLDLEETVDLKELLVSEVFQSEALVNLLERKGNITRQELLEEIKMLIAERPKSES